MHIFSANFCPILFFCVLKIQNQGREMKAYSVVKEKPNTSFPYLYPPKAAKTLSAAG